jgi:uncharacterized protein YecE (DUF72 family)
LAIKVGTCGFQKARRKHYSELDVVEVQQTFYDPRDTRTFERWRREAPEHFEFTVKVWMLVTHGYNKMLWRRLKGEVPGEKENYKPFELNKEVLQAMDATLEAAKVLKARILVFQTPTSFKATEENAGKIIKFIREIGLNEYIIVWEPRGDWWDNKDLIARVAESAGLYIDGDVLRGRIPPREQDMIYTRLHGLGGKGEVNYKYKYTIEDLKKLKSIISNTKASTVYVLFNNVYAFEDAVEFKNIIKESSH